MIPALLACDLNRYQRVQTIIPMSVVYGGHSSRIQFSVSDIGKSLIGYSALEIGDYARPQFVTRQHERCWNLMLTIKAEATIR